MNRTITLSDIEPAPLSLRHPLGVNLDLNVTMKTQRGVPVDPTPLYPQFVLLPRSRGGTYPYDMTTASAASGIARAQVPGTALTDPSGYGIELYLRQANQVPGDPPLPTGLIAKGVLATEGSAYSSSGPMNMINIPVVVGPPGAMGAPGAAGPSGSPGAPGQRGSIWFTGSGAPSGISGALPADMYLDETTGDVYRYDGAMWTRGVF